MQNFQQASTIHFDIPPKKDGEGRSLIELTDNKMFNFEMPITDFINTEHFNRLDVAVKNSIRSWL